MSPTSNKALRRMRQLESLRPRTADQLDRFLRVVMKLSVPRRPVVEGNQAPFDYLAAAFFGDGDSDGFGDSGDCGGGDSGGAKPQAAGGGDLIVWANRGGGKTQLGAAATVLDLLFKPGIQVRILGGSMEQSSKMYAYLLKLVDRPLLRGVLASEPTRKRVALINDSAVELLSQSQRSVRGTRVHKLRCDEVEEFDREIWDAAQMVTRSGVCGGVHVRGTIEGLSTMHRPFGLMSRLVARARRAEEENAKPQAAGGLRLFRWCALDVIERCPPERDCGSCILWNDCGGRAKEADGFVSVDDLVAQRHRSSNETWDSEMMCKRPVVNDCVYHSFTPAKHVVATGPGGGRTTLVAGMRREIPDLMTSDEPYVFARERTDPDSYAWVAGMDFGLRSPLVMLWARLCEPFDAGPRDRVLEVVDEYIEKGLLVEQHLKRIELRGWPKPEWIGVDPAGGQRNSQTGLSDIQLLRQRGYKVRTRTGTIAVGIELIRRRLDRGLLRIDSRCESLIKAMSEYHFNTRRAHDENPVKDGPDHACDALRYLVVNLDLGTAAMKSGKWA